MNPPGRWLGALLTAGALSAAYPAAALRVPEVPTPERLAGYSLEELLDVPLVSVDTDLQRNIGGAGAITVIGHDEIMRSGARSLPELLRRVPGLYVGQEDKNEYVVSARGFSGRYSGKMEVLVDGRRLQTPLYLSVRWAAYDTFLSDIDRIEVIRGPGGAQWGTNAVNGIINIVTRSARRTHGTYNFIGGGSEGRLYAGTRYGGHTEGGVHYRLWTQGAMYDDSDREDGSRATDGERHAEFGFRTDWGGAETGLFNLQGDVRSRPRETVETVYAPGQASGQEMLMRDHFRGADLVMRWARALDDGSDLCIQSYWTYLEHESDLIGEHRNTFDLSANHQWSPGSRHAVTWGGGIYSAFSHADNSFTAQLTPARDNLTSVHLFAQDRITLSEGTTYLTLGSKFEHNDYTGFDFQPSARVIRYIGSRHSLWAALSRVVRTPSQLERDARYIASEPAPDVFVALTGSSSLQEEKLVASEVGYRWNYAPGVALDISTFYNVYSDLRAFLAPGAPQAQNGVTIIPVSVDNRNSGRSWGAEVSTGWHAGDALHGRVGYTAFQLVVDPGPGTQAYPLSDGEGNDPRQQAFLLTDWHVRPDLTLSGNLRYVGQLKTFGIDPYTELGLRAAWSVAPELEVSLIGSNLLDDAHVESIDARRFNAVPVAVPREVWLQLSFRTGAL